MILALIAALLLGVLSGTITGILPGIHINLVSVIIVSLASSITAALGVQPIIIILFISSMAITHTFVDFIPSIYLGCPDEDTGLSVLPGHKMLLAGNGHQAVALTIIGGLAAVFLVVILSPIFIWIIPKLYLISKPVLPFLLIIASLFLIFQEKKKLIAFGIFILAGFLGIGATSLPIQQPLLPLLSGLFGVSSIISSIASKTKVPRQNPQSISVPKGITVPLLSSIIVSPLCSFLPGITSAQSSAICASFFRKIKNEQFLVLLGSISTIVTAISFLILYSIEKTRTGVAVALSQLSASPLSSQDILLILIAVLFSGIFSAGAAFYLSKFLSRHIHKFNYTLISITVLIFVTVLVIYFSGLLSLLVLITASAIGLIAISAEIRRTQLMGCLLLPTILFYLL